MKIALYDSCNVTEICNRNSCGKKISLFLETLLKDVRDRVRDSRVITLSGSRILEGFLEVEVVLGRGREEEGVVLNGVVLRRGGR